MPPPPPPPPRRPGGRRPAASTAAWLVYVLRCGDGSLYTGITNDIVRRLAAHSAGRASRYTRSRLPVRLVHTEEQPTKSAALKREAAIKRLTRPAKLRLVGAAAAPAASAAARPASVAPRSASRRTRFARTSSRIGSSSQSQPTG